MIADLSASFAVVDLEPAPDTRAMGLHRQQGDVLESQKRFKSHRGRSSVGKKPMKTALLESAIERLGRTPERGFSMRMRDNVVRATPQEVAAGGPLETTLEVTGGPSATSTRTLEPAVWKPSTAQFKYLAALEEAITANEPYSDRALSTKLKMSRTTIWEWKHDPRFCRWYDCELNETSDLNWPLIIRKHEMLAMRGSVRSAEFLAKVRFTARLPLTHQCRHPRPGPVRHHSTPPARSVDAPRTSAQYGVRRTLTADAGRLHLPVSVCCYASTHSDAWICKASVGLVDIASESGWPRPHRKPILTSTRARR